MAYKPLDAQIAFTAFMEKTRKERGLTYGALAEKSGLHISTVHEILRGRPLGSPTAVSFVSLCTLANALGLYFCMTQGRTGKKVMRHPGAES